MPLCMYNCMPTIYLFGTGFWNGRYSIRIIVDMLTPFDSPDLKVLSLNLYVAIILFHIQLNFVHFQNQFSALTALASNMIESLTKWAVKHNIEAVIFMELDPIAISTYACKCVWVIFYALCIHRQVLRSIVCFVRIPANIAMANGKILPYHLNFGDWNHVSF